MPTTHPSIHYLGVLGTATQWGDHSQCVAQWERIKAERSDEYGPDGAYSFGACNSHGIRMVGRGWDRSSAANGQENGVDYNPGSRALCILVGTDDEITPQCEKAVADFADEAFARGMDRPLKGHSEFVATSCPGDHLRQVIGAFNAGALVPGPPPEEEEDDDMTVWLCLEQSDMRGAWVQEGPYMLIHRPTASDVKGNGRSVVVDTATMKLIQADVNKARTAAGIK